MHSKIVLEYCKGKDTENKYRWCVMVDKTRFSLYIPKWRVPQPIPTRLRFVIFLPDDKHPDLSELNYSKIAIAPELIQSPIVAKLTQFSDHTDTIRYDPIGSSNDREIGSPYIPRKLLPKDAPSELTISVEWLAG